MAKLVLSCIKIAIIVNYLRVEMLMKDENRDTDGNKGRRPFGA
jgi:hypothetical protein